MQDLSQMSTEELLRMRNGSRPTAQPAPTRGPVFGPAPAPEKPPTPPAPPSTYDVQQDLVSNEQSLRKEFYSLPAVKEYQVAGRTYANSLQAGDDASGDQSLIVAYAKMLDPGSVVREGEAASVAGTDSTIGRSIAKLQKELGFANGGTLSPDIRTKIRREMRTLAENYGASYTQERKQFESLASSYGFEPTRIVGQDILDPYRKTIDEYWAKQEEALAGEQDTPAGTPLGGDSAEGYGDDGRGNPLVMGDGQVLLGYESDAPQYGPVGQNKNIDPRALELYKRIQSEQKNLGEGGFTDVARSGLTVGLSDEAAGVGEVIGKALTGDFNVGQNFETGRALDNFRTDQGRQSVDAYAGQFGVPQGVASTATELLGTGGAVRSIGAFGQARQAVQSVRNAGAPVNRATVNNALVRRATAEGAGIGLVAGAAQGDTLEERGTNALLGVTTGGIGGRYGQKAGNALANRGAPNAAPVADDVGLRARNLSAASDRVGFTRLNRAMVDPQSNNAVTKADATMVGGRVVQREMQAAADEFGERVGANLGAGGNVIDDVARGDTFKDASVRFIKETGEIANRRYGKAEQLAGKSKVEAATALSASDDILRRLRETPETNKEEIAFIERVRRDLAGQDPDSPGLTVGALRKMRTALRKKISKGDLVFGEDEADVLSIMDAASNDIVAGLTAQGKGVAAEAFRRADTAYAARMKYISNTIQKLVGKRQSNLNAAQVAKKVDSLSTSDYNEFRKAYAMLEPEERLDMAASLAQRLGRESTQTNEAPFSVDTFVSNTAKMEPQALRAVFGPDGAQAVQDLRLIGKEVARVRGAMNSRTSKSGVASYRDWIYSLVAGGGLGGVASGNLTVTAVAAGTAVGGNAVRQGLSARALMSPKITKWLKQAPRTSDPKAINAHYQRLDAIAKSEPALATEIAQMQRQIMSAANDNASRVAAEENDAPQ